MKNRAFIIIVVCFTFVLLACSFSNAQDLASLPPYNFLWPLWTASMAADSDPICDVSNTPIITELSANTVLPVQPAIIWDPVLNPKGPVWLASNIPQAFGGGLTFFEDIYGFMPFPPNYLIDPVTGAPAPITYLPYFSLAYLPTN